MAEHVTATLPDAQQARELAERYHFDFVDLRSFRINPDLLQTVPLDLMMHYEFLPLEAHDHALTVAIGDPTRLEQLDELEAKLDRRLIIKVAAPGQLRELLKATEPSKRVLEEATEDFKLEVQGQTDASADALALEHLVEGRE
ncbi:MAG: pilus assembly protein PilB, partial [Terriglobia bacterium]